MNTPRIEISIDDQRLTFFPTNGEPLTWPVSTSLRGVGFDEGSFRTPTGEFTISEKIGDNADPDTIFRARRAEGIWDGSTTDDDLILARILRLQGQEPRNRNTRERFIYIHGTNHEQRLGTPAGHGCIRMKREDLISLYDITPLDCRVFITPPEKMRERLIFFDCDSTLSSIEGIDELAKEAGPEVFARIKELTDAAMNGEIPLDGVFKKRMESLSPNRDLCATVADRYLQTITPGSRELVKELQAEGWMVVILSGGFEPIIRPLADALDIQFVEAVPLFFNSDGSYRGYDEDYPTTRNGGKPEIIRQWKNALNPEQVVMVGDGISDLETAGEVDLFIGYGGVVSRSRVREEAALWITHFQQLDPKTLYQHSS